MDIDMGDELTLIYSKLMDVYKEVGHQSAAIDTLREEYVSGRERNIKNMEEIKTKLDCKVDREEIPWMLKMEAVLHGWRVVLVLLLVLASLGFITIRFELLKHFS